jgi:hypothetical protein
MSIESLPRTPGAQRALAVCDDCGRKETIAASYKPAPHKPHVWHLDEGQAVRKLNGMGWAHFKKKLRCPECEAKRKSQTKPLVVMETTMETPREPTKAQKREIMDLLGSAYDPAAERYTGGETDETVAKVLGVMPGWVSQLREEFFGPDGGNEDIDRLAAEVADFLKEARAALTVAEESVKTLTTGVQRVEEFAEKLDRIKAAVGPRKLKVAGV